MPLLHPSPAARDAKKSAVGSAEELKSYNLKNRSSSPRPRKPHRGNHGPSKRRKPAPAWLLVAAAVLIAIGLVWVEQRLPITSGEILGSTLPAFPPGAPAGSGMPSFHASVEALKLVFARLIGGLISAAHRRHPGDKPISRSLAQAQILLCVAGALMMIIINDSLARPGHRRRRHHRPLPHSRGGSQGLHRALSPAGPRHGLRPRRIRRRRRRNRLLDVYASRSSIGSWSANRAP